MKTFTLLVAFTCLGIFSWSAQARRDWVVPLSGLAPCLVADSFGNVFAAQQVNNETDDDIVVAKFDGTGSLVWSNTFDRGQNERPVSIALDQTGAILVMGTASNGQAVVTLKYDSAGQLLWAATYVRPGDEGWRGEYPVGLVLGSDGSVHVAGTAQTVNPFEDYEYVTLKYTTLGEPVWTNWIRGIGGDASSECLAGLGVDEQGSVIVAGGPAYIAAKYSSNGTGLWTNLNIVPGAAATAMAVDQQGNTYLSGDGPTVKLNPAGEVSWSAPHGMNRVQAMVVGSNGTVTVAGQVIGPWDDDIMWVTQHSDSGAVLRSYGASSDDNSAAHKLIVDEAGNVSLASDGFRFGNNRGYYQATAIGYSPEGSYRLFDHIVSIFPVTVGGITANGQGQVFFARTGFDGPELLRHTPAYAPPLAISHSGTNVVLSWSGPGTNIVVETSQALGFDAYWIEVTNPRSFINGRSLVTVPSTADSRVFRIRAD